MFSPENRRFSLIAICIVSIIVIVIVAMVVLFGLDLFEGEKKISQSTLVAVGAITAFAGIAINQLFIILRYEQGYREGQQERKFISQQVNEAKAEVAEVKDKADANREEIVTLKEQAITVNRSDLKALLKETSEEICREMSKPKGS